MRTTLDLPADLIQEALKASRQRSKTALIIAALEEFVRKRNLQQLKRYKGKVDLDIDLPVLRKRR